MTGPKKIVRFVYHRGKVHETVWTAIHTNWKPRATGLSLRAYSGVMTFLPGEGPSEAAFNGLKYSRLYQFSFYRSSGTAVMFAAAEDSGYWRLRFVKQVERLKRRGTIVERA